MFFDFFYCVVCLASDAGCIHGSAYLGPENGDAVLRLTLTKEIGSFPLEKGLVEAIRSAGGIYSVKEFDGAVGLSLSFRVGENNV